jgi:outer membrane autotransporter protein
LHCFEWGPFRRILAASALAAVGIPATHVAQAQGTSAPPVANPASMTVALNTPTTLDLAPFVSGSGLTGVAVRAAPLHGTAFESGLSITYTPRTDYFGPDSFTYVVFGTLGVSSAATVTVQVTGRPDPARDPAVAGLVDAQNRAARRFAGAQAAGIGRRMEALRRAEPVPPASDAPPTEPATVPKDAKTAAAPRAFAPWLSGTAHFGNIDSTEARAGGRFSSEGITIGVDRRFGPSSTGGFAVGFARDEAKIGDAARSRVRGASLAGYGSWQLGPRTFVDGILGYGKLELDMERHVAPLEQLAKAERDGWQVFGSIAGAYEWRRDNVLVSPYGRLDFLHGRLDAVKESGVGRYALAYASQDVRAAQGAIGARIESRHDVESGIVMPRARVEYRRELGGQQSAEVSYADLAGGSRYAIGAGGITRNTLLLGVGADLGFGGGLRLGLDYAALRASGQSNTQEVRVMLSQDLDALGDWGTMPTLWRNAVSVDFGYAYEDNVSRSLEARDRLWDNVFSMSGTLMRTWPFGSNGRAVATALASGEKFDRWQGLGRFSAGIQAEYQYRTSGAFGAPTYAAVGRAIYELYESNLRTGPRYFAGVNARKPLTDRIELFGEVGVNARYGRSAVFRLNDFAAKANVDYALTSKATLYLAGEYRQGDTVSSGPPSLAAGIADVLAPDDAFEPLGYIAYRVDARTVLGTLGLNYPLGPRDSVDFSWRRSQATTRRSLGPEAADLRYVDNLYSLVYLMRF